MGTVNYKNRSKDMSDNYSSYTSIVSFNFSGLNKVGVKNSSIEYSLKNNYPNPFNPSTQIKYSLAQDADVTLKVYDMLGTEVAELIIELKQREIKQLTSMPRIYQAEFTFTV